MDKSKITQEQWELDRKAFNDGSIIVKTDNGWIDIHCEDAESKATAISAVPEIIEALLEARIYVKVAIVIDEENFGEAIESDLKDLEMINRALAKAGIEVD